MEKSKSRIRLQMIHRVANAYGLQVRRITPCHSFYLMNAAFRIHTLHRDFLVKPFTAVHCAYPSCREGFTCFATMDTRWHPIG